MTHMIYVSKSEEHEFELIRVATQSFQQGNHREIASVEEPTRDYDETSTFQIVG